MAICEGGKRTGSGPSPCAGAKRKGTPDQSPDVPSRCVRSLVRTISNFRKRALPERASFRACPGTRSTDVLCLAEGRLDVGRLRAGDVAGIGLAREVSGHPWKGVGIRGAAPLLLSRILLASFLTFLSHPSRNPLFTPSLLFHRNLWICSSRHPSPSRCACLVLCPSPSACSPDPGRL